MTSPVLRRAAQCVVAAGTVGSVAATAHSLFNLRHLRTPSATPSTCERRVSVLVPARNEAGSIGACLSALGQQTGVPHLEILVYDDRSTDHTTQVVNHHTDDPRVTLVSGTQEPPAGWLGKNWACHQLALQASGEVLCFVDADVVLQPHALAATVEMLQQSIAASSGSTHIDAVCPYPRQLAATPAERLVQPLLQWSWLTFLPLAVAEASPRESLSAANGQLLVIERRAYASIGGHAAISHEVLEDVALFRALKRVGRRGVIADGTRLAECRMYEGWSELVDGYTKSLWSAFGSRSHATAVVTGLAVLYVVPAVAAVRGSKWGATGYAAAVIGRAAVAQHTGARVFPDVLAHPASITLFGYLTVVSWRRKSRGRLTWKQRNLSEATTSSRSQPPGRFADWRRRRTSRGFPRRVLGAALRRLRS